MSPELEDTLKLENEPTKFADWQALITVDGHQSSHNIISIEDNCDGDYVVLLDSAGYSKFFTSTLLDSREVSVSLQDRSFKAKVLKLESDRAYLKISR